MEDVGQLLIESLEAIHNQNTGRRIRCRYCPGVYFLTADALFKHRAQVHTHPSTGGDRG